MSKRAKPKFRVGQKVSWYGQEHVKFTEAIMRITEPQPGNYVLWVGRDDYPINYQQVIGPRKARKKP